MALRPDELIVAPQRIETTQKADQLEKLIDDAMRRRGWNGTEFIYQYATPIPAEVVEELRRRYAEWNLISHSAGMFSLIFLPKSSQKENKRGQETE